MNYYEHHIGDYEADTSHLSLVEDAIYGRMLRRYYRQECALPVSVEEVSRLIRARDQAETVKAVLLEFFQLADDGWHHKRCDEEIAKFREKQGRASASAKSRWANVKPECERNANALPTHSERNAHQTPDTNHQTPAKQDQKKGRGKRAADPECPEGVDPQTWADWLVLRRAKSAPVTPTVVSNARDEAAKAGLSLTAFLAVWCARGSQGLQADWLKPNERAGPPATAKPSAAADFRGKTYDATPIANLPAHLRDAAERAMRDD